jgi:serine/threonine-protein kinase
MDHDRSEGWPVRLSDLSAPQFARISALLDEFLEQSLPERLAALARLDDEDPRAAELLRRLLVSPDASPPETRDLLRAQVRAVGGDAPELALVGRQVGPYRVLSSLGRGGMSTVWLAERADGLFTRRVALKLLHPSLLGSGADERFARERAILAGLEHPHIARLLDAGFTDDGQPYLAIEYVAGTAFTDYCDRHRLDLGERLRLFLQVLDAVEYAHAHLVIHRDLKPSNILVADDGSVRLLDFGIAKMLRGGDVAQTRLTQLAGRMLTPEYAAPEQIADGPVTAATDVYSLGVLLFELLTGERPYRLRRDSAAALEEAILAADPHPPSRTVRAATGAGASAAQLRGTTPARLARALSGDLDTIVLKALQKDPAARYPTVSAFAADLRRHRDGHPVLARPDGATYRAFKYVRRHWTALTVVTAIVLALSTALAYSLRQSRIARAEAERAAAVQDFLLGLFDQVDPAKQPRDVTARELLDHGARQLQDKLADEPDLKAMLDGVLADLYAKLADEPRALALAEERRDLMLKARGPRSVEYADALYSLGRLQADLHVMPAAERSFGEAAGIFAAAGPSRRSELLRLRRSLAFLAIEEHHDDDARARLSALIPELERHFGPDSWDVAQGKSHLAAVLAQQGNFDGAARLYASIETALDRAPAEHALDAAAIRGNEGYVLWLAGRLGAAEVAVRSSVATFDRTLRPDNTASITELRMLGVIQQDAGRYADALASFDGAAERAGRLYGPHAGETALNASYRVPALIAVGRAGDALGIARQAASDAAAPPGLGPGDRRGIERRLALALTFCGRAGEASALLDRMSAEEERAGDRSPRHATTLLYRAGAAAAQGQFATAAVLAHGARELFAGDPASRGPALKAALAEALALARAGQGSEAAATLDAASRTTLPEPNPTVDLAVQAVRAEVLRASGDAAGADRLQLDARRRLEDRGVRLPVPPLLVF